MNTTPMEYRRLGATGLKVSSLSLGSWLTFGQIDDVTARNLMKTAYEAGINFFDNAEVYMAGKSEVVMGNALTDLNFPRDTYCVSSKVFWGGDKPTQRGLSRKHIMEACEAALERLKVDYLDLYFCHRPDPDTPMEEIVRSMNVLIEQGKVFYWGTSEWTHDQIEEAIDVASQLGLIPPAMEQPQYNLLWRDNMEKNLVPLFEDHQLGTTIWSPLASGVLTGKYFDGAIPKGSRFDQAYNQPFRGDRLDTDLAKQNLGKAKLLKGIADELGMSLAQLSIAWCLKNPHVSTVILGATKVAQLEENIETLEHLAKITPDVMSQIDQVVGSP